MTYEFCEGVILPVRLVLCCVYNILCVGGGGFRLIATRGVQKVSGSMISTFQDSLALSADIAILLTL